MAIKSYFSLPYYNDAYPEAQAEALYEYGEFLERYRIGDKVIALYAYHVFYIEVTYDPKENEIQGYRGISVDEAVDKYVGCFVG